MSFPTFTDTKKADEILSLFDELSTTDKKLMLRTLLEKSGRGNKGPGNITIQL